MKNAILFCVVCVVISTLCGVADGQAFLNRTRYLGPIDAYIEGKPEILFDDETRLDSISYWLDSLDRCSFAARIERHDYDLGTAWARFDYATTTHKECYATVFARPDHILANVMRNIVFNSTYATWWHVTKLMFAEPEPESQRVRYMLSFLNFISLQDKSVGNLTAIINDVGRVMCRAPERDASAQITDKITYALNATRVWNDMKDMTGHIEVIPQVFEVNYDCTSTHTDIALVVKADMGAGKDKASRWSLMTSLLSFGVQVGAYHMNVDDEKAAQWGETMDKVTNDAREDALAHRRLILQRSIVSGALFKVFSGLDSLPPTASYLRHLTNDKEHSGLESWDYMQVVLPILPENSFTFQREARVEMGPHRRFGQVFRRVCDHDKAFEKLGLCKSLLRVMGIVQDIDDPKAKQIALYYDDIYYSRPRNGTTFLTLAHEQVPGDPYSTFVFNRPSGDNGERPVPVDRISPRDLVWVSEHDNMVRQRMVMTVTMPAFEGSDSTPYYDIILSRPETSKRNHDLLSVNFMSDLVDENNRVDHRRARAVIKSWVEIAGAYLGVRQLLHMPGLFDNIFGTGISLNAAPSPLAIEQAAAAAEEAESFAQPSFAAETDGMAPPVSCSQDVPVK